MSKEIVLRCPVCSKIAEEGYANFFNNHVKSCYKPVDYFDSVTATVYSSHIGFDFIRCSPEGVVYAGTGKAMIDINKTTVNYLANPNDHKRLFTVPENGMIGWDNLVEPPGEVVAPYGLAKIGSYAFIAVDDECDKSEDEIKQMLTATIKNILTTVYKDIVEQ